MNLNVLIGGENESWKNNDEDSSNILAKKYDRAIPPWELKG